MRPMTFSDCLGISSHLMIYTTKCASYGTSTKSRRKFSHGIIRLYLQVKVETCLQDEQSVKPELQLANMTTEDKAGEIACHSDMCSTIEIEKKISIKRFFSRCP